MGFTSIPSGRRDVDSPVEEQILTDLYDRDEALREAPFFFPFAEVSTASAFPTYATVLTKSIYIPTWAKGITMAAQFKKVGGAGCFMQWHLDGAIFDTSGDFTTSDSTYDDTKRITMAAIDTALRGTRVDVIIKLASLSGGTAFAIQTDGPACRFI